MPATTRFHAERAPSPRSFYESEIGKLSRPNSKGWAMGNCPFHKSKGANRAALMSKPAASTALAAVPKAAR